MGTVPRGGIGQLFGETMKTCKPINVFKEQFSWRKAPYHLFVRVTSAKEFHTEL